MVRKKNLSDFRVIQRPARSNPQSLLLPEKIGEDEDEDVFDDEDEDEDEDALDEDEDALDEEDESGEDETPAPVPQEEEKKMEKPKTPRRGGKPATTEKMLLKLRMSSTRQQPVWTEAKDTLAERGFENSAKLAREIEAAIAKFRRVLDAEAKLRAAEEARRELAGIVD